MKSLFKSFFVALMMMVSMTVSSQVTVYETGVGTGDPFTGWTFEASTSGGSVINEGVNNEKYEIQMIVGQVMTYDIVAVKEITDMQYYMDVDLFTNCSKSTSSTTFDTYSLYASTDSVNWDLVSSSPQLSWNTISGGGYKYVKIVMSGQMMTTTTFSFNQFVAESPSALSVKENTSSFNVYSYDKTVKVESQDEYTMTIYNMNGQVVEQTTQYGDYQTQLQTPGVYIVSISTGNVVETEKVYIQ